MQCNFTINPNHPNYSLTCFLLPTNASHLWLSMYKLISDGGEMKLNQSACSKTFTRDGGPYVSFCDLRELHKSHSQQIIVFFSLSFSKKGFFFFLLSWPSSGSFPWESLSLRFWHHKTATEEMAMLWPASHCHINVLCGTVGELLLYVLLAFCGDHLRHSWNCFLDPF